MPSARPARSSPSALRLVWGSRFFRACLLTLLLSGMATSAAIPQLTSFLVIELGASLPLAGLFSLTTLSAPLIGFAMGRISDRREDRLTLFRAGATVGVLGWVAMGLSTQLWMPFVIGVVALGIGGAASAQVYAAARDELSRHPTRVDVEVVSVIRMAFTLGWVMGPVIGSLLGGVVGLRAVMFATAVFAALQLVPMIGIRAPRHVVPEPSRAPGRRAGSLRELAPLLVFSGLAVLAVSGDTVKFAYLPLYMDTRLGLSDGVRGAVIGVQPVFELLLMPLAARVASRVGAVPVVIVGSALGLAANLCYAVSSTAAGLFLGQVLMAGLWAAIAGLGITVAQELYPQGVGVASSTFLSSLAFAASVGGLLGAAFVTSLGMPGVFVVPAVLCGLAAVGMVGLALRLRRPGDPASDVVSGSEETAVGAR